MVSLTGTLVNRFSTSRDASFPVEFVARMRWINSSVEAMEYLEGRYSLSKLLRALAIS